MLVNEAFCKFANKSAEELLGETADALPQGGKLTIETSNAAA
jgi:hypothetical protein